MTHPHDFALLNDLLDGRMGWSAAEELRRRLVEEPALGAAYDELVRMRAGLAQLPRREPPADFLAGVRARAGLAPLPTMAAAAPVPGATPGAEESEGRAPSAVAKPGAVLPWRRLLPAAAAAGLLVGFGAFALWSRSLDRETPTTLAKENKADGDRLSGTEREKLPSSGPAPAARGAGSGVEGSEAGVPRFGAPGGAVPPGLRVPSDTPAAPEPAPQAAGGAPAPEPEPAAPVPAAAHDDVSGGGGGGRGSRGMPGRPVPAAGDKAAAPELSRPGPDLAWARVGADDVLVLRASAYDAARADVALVLAAVRSGASVEGRLKDVEARPLEDARGGTWAREGPAGRRAAPPGGDADEPGAAPSDGASAGLGSAPRPGDGATAGDDEKRKAAADAESTLGTFVIEVTDEEWARLASAFAAPPSRGGEDLSTSSAPEADTTRRLPSAPPSSPSPAASPPSPSPAASPPAPPLIPEATAPTPPAADAPPAPTPPVPPAGAPPPGAPTAGAPVGGTSGAPPVAEETEAVKPPAAKAAERADKPGASAPNADGVPAPRRRVRIVVLGR